LPEEGDKIQSLKRCVLKNKQDGVLDKDRMTDNVQKHNICTVNLVIKLYGCNKSIARSSNNETFMLQYCVLNICFLFDGGAI
jgi:hypothetical protein